MEEKTCNTCHLPKPLSEFYKRGDKKGHRPDCKECYKIKDRLRNNSDKETARLTTAEEIEAIESNPYGFLAGGVIHQAILDKADEFFETMWYEELRDGAGMREHKVLECRKRIGGLDDLEP